MKTYNINLNLIEDVKAFASDINKEIKSKVLIKNDMYVLNAKSLLGILSLDLSEPIEVSILSEDINELKRFKEIIRKYEVCI